MTEGKAFENGRICNFEGLVTFTLNQVILHTVLHHSLTSTYMPNFIEIFVDKRMDGHLRPALLGRLCQSRPSKQKRSVPLNYL